MKNVLFRACLATFSVLAMIVFLPLAMLAGPDSLTTMVDYGNPASFVDTENVNGLMVGVMMIAGYLAGFIPGLKNIKQGVLKAIVSGFIVVAGAATFKLGFLTEESLQFVLASFFPNFAFSGVTYEILKALLKLIGVNLKKVDVAAE